MVGNVRARLKELAHRSGGLAAYHRVRNRRWLTVLCLHRVLPPSDPRWNDRDREWTISADQLSDCVSFAKRHFNPVTLEQVLAAHRRSAPLPSRPILFTFDDGWADNEEYALPILEAAGVPGVIFVTSDALDRKNPFWFEILRQSRLGGRIDDETWAHLWKAADRPAPPSKGSRELEELIKIFAAYPATRRDQILGPFVARLEDGHRHMVTVEQLKRLRARGFAVGAHGRTHQPFPTAENLQDELAEPRRRLEALLGEPITTLAFPHGRFTADVLTASKAAGYELVFTGEHELAPVGKVPFAIGRIPITPEGLEDERGRFPDNRMAIDLFRTRHLKKPSTSERSSRL